MLEKNYPILVKAQVHYCFYYLNFRNYTSFTKIENQFRALKSTKATHVDHVLHNWKWISCRYRGEGLLKNFNKKTLKKQVN